MSRREPVGQIVDDAGKEPSLGRTEEKPHAVELQRRPNQHHADRERAPGSHDPCNPAAGAKTHQKEV